MNFAQMLMTPIRPHEPEGKRSGNPHPDHLLANAAKSRRAFERYSAVMSTEGWTRTQDIRRRLCYSMGTVNGTMNVFLARGLVERRPYGGGEFNRKAGWEWRIKKP